MLIMIVRYRLNGVVAAWALCIYINRAVLGAGGVSPAFS